MMLCEFSFLLLLSWLACHLLVLKHQLGLTSRSELPYHPRRDSLLDINAAIGISITMNTHDIGGTATNKKAFADPEGFKSINSPYIAKEPSVTTSVTQ